MNVISSTGISKARTYLLITKAVSKFPTLVSRRKLMIVSVLTSGPVATTESFPAADLLANKMHRFSLQGSVFWMAPEVVKQSGHTLKADIWSVGCLVVEMLTGEHPWAQLTQMQAIFKVRHPFI